MPGFVASQNPAAVPGLTDGTFYSFQNKGPWPVFLEVASAAPADSSGAFVLAARGERGDNLLEAKADTGESVYLWTGRDVNCAVAFGATD